jgi:hypothetical protein
VIEDAAKQASAIDARLGKRRARAHALRSRRSIANAILTIHPGAGGTDAKDWASMLMRMYLRWASARHKTEVLDYQDGDEAGIDAVSIAFEGDNAYGYLRSGAGVHRLVRMSPFNADHTRQTAFAAVEVMPDARRRHRHRHPRQGRRDHDDARRRQGRAEREQGRDGGPSAPPADRHQHRVPRRAQPAPEPRHGDAHPQGEAVRDRAAEARERSTAANAEERHQLRQPDPKLRARAVPSW